MKYIFISFFAFLTVIINTGCATITYHDHFGKSGSERGEFSDFDEKYMIYKGVLAEESLIRSGNKYYHLKFSGALAGSGRVLNVLVPHEFKVDPVIFETAENLSAGKNAYLFVVRTCCVDDKKIFDHIASREIEADSEKMKKYLLSDFPESADSKNWPAVFCELALTNVNNYSLMHKVWNPSLPAKDAAVFGLAFDQPYSKMDIKWKNRSAVKLVAIKAGYLFPVIIDIVTSPVQLVGVIIYFAMGGAVK